MKKNPGLSKSLTMKSSQTLLRVVGSLFLLLALSFSPVFAGENFLSEKIQLKVDNVTLKDALKEIERQSTFTFLYNDALIDVNQTLSFSSKEQSVKELLDQILAKRGINYTIIENQIVLTKSAIMQEGKRTITGTVTDSDSKQALPGVPILIKGTTNGTVTDMDGNYTLSVTEDAVLVITYVGYVSEEIPVANRTDFSIGLIPDIINLEDVVVIGYGTVKKSDITGAVASVSAEQLQQSSVSGVDQALQGRTAGVSVTTNSGSPGTAPTVRIRGVGTINNPDPFFVVDGMPMTASEVGALNPGDIERTEILKDASAAAIYGSRAANGVVLITTKRGKAGTSNVNFDAYIGTQSLAKKYELLNARDYVTVRNAAGIEWEDSSQVQNTDWQDEIFRAAKVENYQLSFTGGSEKLQYALIGNYFNQEGILKGSDYERYSFRINTSADLKKWLTVSENVSYNLSNRNVLPEQDEYLSAVVSALGFDPTTPVYLEDQTGRDKYSIYSNSLKSNVSNPVGIVERNYNKINTTKLLGNVSVDIKPVTWLTYRLTMGTEISKDKQVAYLPKYYEGPALFTTTNQLINTNVDKRTNIMENTLTFNKKIGDKHDLTILAGYTRQSNNLRFLVSSVTGVPEDENLWFISNVSKDSADIYDLSIDREGSAGKKIFDCLNNSVFRDVHFPYESALVSYLGRLLYTYDGKVDINASIRRDGSSRFGANNRWGIFPSYALGLKLSEFDFMKNLPQISFLKLRYGWGKLGNQEVGDYRTYTNINYMFDYPYGPADAMALHNGGAPTSVKNEDIHWETVIMSNLGLDLSMFQNKISLNVDLFKRTTTDMLVESPIPTVTGVLTPPLQNKGSIQNKGIEINAIYKGKMGDFSYEIAGNIAFIRNEVLELGEEDDYIISGLFRASDYANRTEVGQPVASFYGFKTDGYWNSQEEIDEANAKAKLSSANTSKLKYFDTRDIKPGDIKMVDLNGDSLLNSADREFIGNPNPTMTYGINISLKYKILDLSFFGQGVHGNKIFQGLIFYNESPVGDYSMSPSMLDYWTPDNQDASVPRLGNLKDNARFSDRYIKDGSFFRIKNIQLGVSLPSEICQKIKVEKVRVYVAVQNLKTFSKYSGFDPEIGTGSSTLDIGIDRGFYPISRSYMVGVNFTF
jgi:TonB-dependent starch-binding outer membrane protein SusC